MKNAIIKISDNIVKVCFGIFAIIYGISNIFFSTYTNRSTFSNEFNFGLNFINVLVFVVLFSLLLVLIKKNFFKIHDYKLLIGFLLLSFIVGAIWILISDKELKDLDDTYNCFHAAINIANGDYGSLSYKSYLSVYPNNFGFVSYLIFIIKIFGENCLYLLRFINLFFVLLGYFALYKITNELFKNRIVNCVLIYLMFGNMQFVFYSFIIYGNCISYALALLSLYFLIKYLNTYKIKNIIICALFIVSSIVIKNNSLIILIAEIIYLLLNAIDKKKIINLLFIGILIVSTFLGTFGLQRFWGNKGDINYDDTKLPTLCWVAYGVNYNKDRPGSYTNQFENYHALNGYVGEFTKQEAQRFIDDTFIDFKNNPTLAMRFYFQKFLASWSDPSFNAFDNYGELDKSAFVDNVLNGNINKCIYYIWDGFSSIIACGLLVIVIKKYKGINLYSTIGMCIVIGGFLFHLIWEVKAIYLYQYFMYLLPYGAYGISLLFKDDVTSLAIKL